MKLFMTPGSCSTGIHILMEEIGLVFEAEIVDLLAGDQNTASYLAMNPKASIPVLQLDDGTALTEFPTIAYWLARAHPRRKLLPEDPLAAARVLEVVDYVVSTVHMQGFARLFTTEKFTPNAADHDQVQARGREIITQAFAVLDPQLDGRTWFADDFSIADAAYFYVAFWATRTDVALPPNGQAHFERMAQRPAVRQVLAEEGYRLT